MSDLWRVFSSSPFFFYLNSSLLNMICLWGTFFLVIGIFILVPLTRPLWRKTNGHAATPDLSLHSATCHSHYIYASKPGSGYRSSLSSKAIFQSLGYSRSRWRSICRSSRYRCFSSTSSLQKHTIKGTISSISLRRANFFVWVKQTIFFFEASKLLLIFKKKYITFVLVQIKNCKIFFWDNKCIIIYII